MLYVWLIYLSWHLVMYWLPLLAVRLTKQAARQTALLPGQEPRLLVISPCHNAATSLPGLIHSVRSQTYPSTRTHILILADNCSDNSADVARKLGADVYQRHNPQRMGKGYALNELFERRLNQEMFDGVVMLDVDARVAPDFLSRVGAYFQAGAFILQGATISKNPDDTVLTKVGDGIQGVIRCYQKGRALLGLHPMMIGSHGIALSRASLERLDWRLTTDVSGDDIELGLRAFLRDIPVRYAADLLVCNDLPGSSAAVRRQRRRWTRSTVRLSAKYFLPLLKKGLQGSWKSFDVLFNVLLNPSFANLFIFIALTAVGLLFWARPLAWFGLGLFAAMCAYFGLVFAMEKISIRPRNLAAFLWYLLIRTRAFTEGVVLARSRAWWPTHHKGDTSS